MDLPLTTLLKVYGVTLVAFLGLSQRMLLMTPLLSYAVAMTPANAPATTRMNRLSVSRRSDSIGSR